MINFLLYVVIWLPIIFYWAVFVAALLLYAFRHHEKAAIKSKFLNYRVIIIGTIVFRFLYALLESVAQYYVWTTSDLTRSLLNSPLSDKVPPEGFIVQAFPSLFKTGAGYFLYYAYGRFFLNAILVVICAFIFYFILKALQKYQDRFFDTGETELGFLCCLIVGWPAFVVFVPLAFVAVVIVSVFRGIFFRELYTTLGYPFLLAALMCLILGENLITMFNLLVLKV